MTPYIVGAAGVAAGLEGTFNTNTNTSLDSVIVGPEVIL